MKSTINVINLKLAIEVGQFVFNNENDAVLKFDELTQNGSDDSSEWGSNFQYELIVHDPETGSCVRCRRYTIYQT